MHDEMAQADVTLVAKKSHAGCETSAKSALGPMTDTSKCLRYSCRETVEGSVDRCPKCNTRMRRPKDVRRRGWLLVALGLFLVIFMGWILLSELPVLLYPGQRATDGSSFTGTAEQAKMILTLFTAVIVFGIAAAVNGAWLAITARPSMVLTIVTLVIAAGLIFYAYSTTMALSQDREAVTLVEDNGATDGT
jgi:hypothetical protein